jgi:hypothetical protein
MIGLSSVSYVKKTSSNKDLPPSISTSMSSPRMMNNTGCPRSPFSIKRQQQLPVFIRKQQQEREQEKEEEDDDREIIKNNHGHNTYGVPHHQSSTTVKKQQQQQKSIVTQSDLNQKIRVCVRKRPLSKKELEKCEKDITPVASVRTVHVNEPK